MTIDEKTEKLSVVPEVFYDLICRIPAGIIVLVSVYASIPMDKLPNVLSNIGDSTLAVVIVPIIGIAVSYSIGLALSALSGISIFIILDLIYWYWISKGFKGLRDLEPLQNILTTNIKFWKRNKARVSIHVLLDKSDRHIGLELSKHQAESSLFANLAVGFLVLNIVYFILDIWNACSNNTDFNMSDHVYWVNWILFIFCANMAYLRNIGFWKFLFAYAESYCNDK